MKELIRFAREKSAFYRELYGQLPDDAALTDLPVLDPESFWSANSIEDNRLLTGPMTDGIVLKSGGTTGRPKFSVFTRDEWNGFTQAFARCLARNGVRDGDRVANVFYAGGLYGSFIFTHKVFEECPVRCLQLPISGGIAVDDVVHLAEDYGATVLAGVPTTILGIVEAIERSRARPPIRLVLFAGEAMYPDQRAQVLRALPGAEIRSIGYASTDAGLLGYSDLSCAPGEFRCHDGAAIYEILDEESGAPITVVGRAGRAVVTELWRRLMPVIRYPVGDRAEWLEPPGTRDRKFLLLGRSEESARVGPVTLYYDDVRAVLEGFAAELGTFRFQLVIVHRELKDGLVLRLAPALAPGAALAPRIVEALLAGRPMYRDCLSEGKIRPIEVEWCDGTGLEANPRTGKLKRILDRRGEA